MVVVDPKVKAQRFDDAKSIQFIKSVILGDSQDGFGPLVRKWYVETNEAFPEIIYA